MDTQESTRAPCPDRILTDAGGAFAFGAIGGTAFHFLKGLRSSPSGARFIGGAEAVRMNAPRVGGSFAIWCGLFSTFDCAFAYTRQKEDSWNPILAGAATSGLLAMRQGLLPMGRAALGGALILAFIEGVNLTVTKAAINAQQQQQMMPPVMSRQAPMLPRSTSQETAAPSWFGGFFRKKKEEVKSYVKDTVLESFDSPMPPNFDFE
ncbi:hypothetical protein Tco_0434838 [Tanacetum coccineum]